MSINLKTKCDELSIHCDGISHIRKDRSQKLQPLYSKPKQKEICPNFTCGLALKPATPIKAVISNFYGKISIDNLHEIYSKPRELKTLKWNSTRGFELFKNSKLQPLSSSQSLFKMKKFRRVSSRIDCWRKNKLSNLE